MCQTTIRSIVEKRMKKQKSEIKFEEAFPKEGLDQLKKAIKEDAEKQSSERKERNKQLSQKFRKEDGETSDGKEEKRNKKQVP